MVAREAGSRWVSGAAHPQQLEQLANKLEQTQQRSKDAVSLLQKEHWKWQQLKGQMDNVLEGKSPREPKDRSR